MLLVLEPLALILFTIGESIDTIALTLTLGILALVSIAILKHCVTLAMRLAGNHFTFVFTAVACGARAHGNLLGRAAQRQKKHKNG